MTDRPAKVASLAFVNARSYRSIALRLSPGLNVIVGESDSGKTNVVRNARTLVENDALDAIRRFGTPDTEPTTITLTTTDAQEFTLERSASLNQCRWEAPLVRSVGRDNDIIEHDQHEQWTSIGNGTPEEYRRRLGLSPIDLSGVEADIHFSDQRDPLFVVDDPPSKVAKIVGSVSGLDVLYRGVTAGDKARRDAAAQVTAATKVRAAAAAQQQIARDRVERLRPLAAAVAAAESARLAAAQRVADLRETARRYAVLRDKTKHLTEARQRLAAAQEAAAAAYDRAAALSNALADLHRSHNLLATAQEAHHDAQEALADARRSQARTAQALGATPVECPTCGTAVTAAHLADRH